MNPKVRCGFRQCPKHAFQSDKTAGNLCSADYIEIQPMVMPDAEDNEVIVGVGCIEGINFVYEQAEDKDEDTTDGEPIQDIS